MVPPADFRHLSDDLVRRLHRTLVDAGMATNRKLDDLGQGLNRRFVASIDDAGPASGRLLRILHAMNAVRRLVDGTVPMAQWLAAAELMMSELDEVVVVREALREVELRRAGNLPADGAPTSLPLPSPASMGVLERARKESRPEMLPFAFLARGAVVGKSVGLLQVPEIVDGVPIIESGRPKLHLGTAWLITSNLVVTNHHVVNARDVDVPVVKIASDADLQAQSASATIEFDYLSPAAKRVTETISSIEAWSPLHGALDYAILRLSSPRDTERPALMVRRARLQLPPSLEDYPALNIIQHPNGGPKMVAFRNNQLAQIVDDELHYYTDTLRGSSGSPVLDDEWRVVALHKKWAWLQLPGNAGAKGAWANAGTSVDAILGDLAKRFPAVHEEIRASAGWAT